MSSVKVKFELYLTWTPFVDFGQDSIPFWFGTVLWVRVPKVECESSLGVYGVWVL